MLELTFPNLALRQAFTPTDQEQLNTSDTDLGSSAPALLGGNRVMVAGKDGIMRVLELSALNGRSLSSHTRLGGELQRLPLPGGGELFTAPAVWRHGGHTTVFVGAENATAAYVLRRGRLDLAWQNDVPGTSPVLAGGLLYVYNPDARRDRRIPSRLAPPIAVLARPARALEQPDRRRWPRGRARGRRQRSQRQLRARCEIFSAG